MTALAAIIRERIAAEGQISVAAYMDLCLAHPEHGYYRSRDPLGRAGDFTTAPEISQMFGEMIGLWAAQVWLDTGAPGVFALTELGPGRGTLMADALRAAKVVPGFAEAAQVWLVETSPVLRAAQAGVLPQAKWAGRLDEVPDLPLILIANEFFDALPARQFVRTGEGWRERMVVSGKGGLEFGQGDAAPEPGLDAIWPGVAEGTLVELSLPALEIAAGIGKRLAQRGGAALVVDYGAWQGTGDTLQALRGHQMTNPLAEPGQADLTTHVNFSQLAQAARPARCWPLLTQGEFLTRLGIVARAGKLAEVPGQKAPVALALRRLTGAAEMGSLFKAMALTGPDGLIPPGFGA